MATEQTVNTDEKGPSFFALIEGLKKMLNVTEQDHVIAVAGVIVANDTEHMEQISREFDRVTDAEALDAKFTGFMKFGGWRPRPTEQVPETFPCPRCGHQCGEDDIDGCETFRCPKCGEVFEPEHQCRGHLLESISLEEMEQELEICEAQGRLTEASAWGMLLGIKKLDIAEQEGV